MKIYKFQYAKLVRDNIPEIIKKANGKISFKRLSKKDYVSELIKKLKEESQELDYAREKEDILDELSDIKEVSDNLLKTLGYTDKDLKTAQAKKNKINGSFKKKIYINYITVNETYNWLKYHLQNKDKYPLIK